MAKTAHRIRSQFSWRIRDSLDEEGGHQQRSSKLARKYSVGVHPVTSELRRQEAADLGMKTSLAGWTTAHDWNAYHATLDGIGVQSWKMETLDESAADPS